MWKSNFFFWWSDKKLKGQKRERKTIYFMSEWIILLFKQKSFPFYWGYTFVLVYSHWLLSQSLLKFSKISGQISNLIVKRNNIYQNFLLYCSYEILFIFLENIFLKKRKTKEKVLLLENNFFSWNAYLILYFCRMF